MDMIDLRDARTRLLALTMAFGCGLALVTPCATAGGAPEIAPMPVDAPLDDAGRYPPEMVVPGNTPFDGAYRAATTYRSVDARFVVSLWQSGPGVLQTDGYPHDEYCRVLEGRVIITNRSGTRTEYGPGDSFVIPKGWAGTWDMPVRFTKQFVAMLR
jgi:uncharacterized cupin superfamily protein